MADAQTSEALRAQVEAVLEANRAARAELLTVLDALTDEQHREVWFGTWSLHELIAHIAAWQDGFALAVEQMLRGERPAIPGFDSAVDDSEATDRFNATVAEGASAKSWETLLSELRSARERHEAVVRRIPGVLDPDRFVEGRTARRLADSANHDREHIDAILEWRRSKGYRS
ncbi:MAG: DinB family protein [Dehalococcoidia bacterium]|nr:MAG: DinB family protein [Dehalococcoidia bacterium]